MTNRLATDSNGIIIWRWEGEAFGNTPAQELGTVSVNLRFPGQYYDSETNLHYNWHRYYDPSLGRYITSDPIGLTAGMNTYSYAMQNSVIFYDPDGEILVPGILAIYIYHKMKSGWPGILPGRGGPGHHNRNVNQSCPATEPCKNERRCGEKCKDWVYDGPLITHCNYKSYRGNATWNKGYQCVYDDNGNLVTEILCAGSYDKHSPYDEQGNFNWEDWKQHFEYDIYEWIWYGN